MSKLIMMMFHNLVLLVLAIILAVIVGPLGIIYTFIGIICRLFNPKKNNFMIKLVGYISNTSRGVAKGIDQIGNVVCRDLFNDVLIRKNGYKFGDVGETISSVLGKNERKGTLTNVGYILAGILNKIEKDHCRKSIVIIIRLSKDVLIHKKLQNEL